MYKYKNLKKYNYFLLGKKSFNLINIWEKKPARLLNKKIFNLKKTKKEIWAIN